MVEAPRETMDANGVRRKDTTKGPPLRVLSLDGGGVRGYSMLIIVQELMHRTYVEINGTAPRRNQIPKPCDHFDLIVGTGTGGLIALMLGRLRLDLETCKELYVRLTRMVFETDKTIAGIPYRSTLFKASKLEAAIKEAVREHTVDESEGNDGTPADLTSPLSSSSYHSSATQPRRHSSNASVTSFSARSPQAQFSSARSFNGQWGDANARLYDSRERRTKTAVLTMYKGAGKNSTPMILRSYDSRREPPPEFDCKIWEAGRATCSIGLAFKPIQIGQSVFHDDGAGPFNPSPEALDEAVVNEWPGRDIGVFVSVGTGRRPKGTDGNQQMWYEGFLGDFADARRRLIAKIEACETTHEKMMRELLPKRNVNIENYFRLNVEMGVGEFGMNEWHRLADISSGTRQYLRREDEQKMIHGATSRLAKIHKAHLRLSRLPDVPELMKSSSSLGPFAVELPGDVPDPSSAMAAATMHRMSAHRTPPPGQRPHSPPSRQSYDSGIDNLHLHQPGGSGAMSPSSSNDRFHSSPPPQSTSSSRPPTQPVSGLASVAAPGTPSITTPSAVSEDGDRLLGAAPTPSQYRHNAGADKIAIMSPDEHPRRPNAQPGQDPSQQSQPPQRIPPPLPPKTPLPERQGGGPGAPLIRPPPLGAAPYPMDDEPPPVNMARKPNFVGR